MDKHSIKMKFVEGTLTFIGAVTALSGAPASQVEVYVEQGKEAVTMTHRARIEQAYREVSNWN